MIAHLAGRIALKEPTFLVMDVGGVGYEIKISLNTYSFIKDKETCKLFTYLHITENAHTLYGFWDIEEKKLFIHLLSVSGVGPSSAVMILSSIEAPELRNVIIHEDARTLQGVKGVGAKTAQRIVLELKDKMRKDAVGTAVPDMIGNSHNTLRDEALNALVTLGFPKNAAEKNIQTILKNTGADITLEELIKRALKTT